MTLTSLTASDDGVMPDSLTIGRRIRQLRTERGLTLDDLGVAIGRAASQVSVVENGKRISFVGNVHVVIVNDDPADKAPPRILTSNAEPAEGSR